MERRAAAVEAEKRDSTESWDQSPPQQLRVWRGGGIGGTSRAVGRAGREPVERSRALTARSRAPRTPIHGAPRKRASPRRKKGDPGLDAAAEAYADYFWPWRRKKREAAFDEDIIPRNWDVVGEGDCDDGSGDTVTEWFFGPYEGVGTVFDPTVQWNGTFRCEDECSAIGRGPVGARWVCNHWDGTTSEGCGPDNHGAWSPEWCTEQVIDGVYIPGDNPACGGETQLLSFLFGSTGNESYTWHALECQCR